MTAKNAEDTRATVRLTGDDTTRTENEYDCDGESDGGDGVRESIQEDGKRFHRRGVPHDERAQQEVVILQELHTQETVRKVDPCMRQRLSPERTLCHGAHARWFAVYEGRHASRRGKVGRTGAIAAAYFCSVGVPPRFKTCIQLR